MPIPGRLSATYFFLRYLLTGFIPIIAMVIPPLLLTAPLWTTWTWGWPQVWGSGKMDNVR